RAAPVPPPKDRPPTPSVASEDHVLPRSTPLPTCVKDKDRKMHPKTHGGAATVLVAGISENLSPPPRVIAKRSPSSPRGPSGRRLFVMVVQATQRPVADLADADQDVAGSLEFLDDIRIGLCVAVATDDLAFGPDVGRRRLEQPVPRMLSAHDAVVSQLM